MQIPQPSRDRTARAAADALQRPAPPPRALIGFDGFIDEITEVVDRRRHMTPDGYDRITTIEAFAARIAAAAGRSANIELVIRERRFGGNGPLLAGALAALGAEATYFGAVGLADDPARIDPAFAPFAARCRRVVPIAPPGVTRALEFHDGKVMFNEPSNVQQVTWDRLLQVVGLDELTHAINGSGILGIVNWTLLGGVEGIWRGLIDHVLPKLTPSPDRRLFIDLTDPAKRTDADLSGALALLTELNRQIPVTLGLNLAEAERVARVLALDAFAARENATLGLTVEHAAAAIRERLALFCVVIHPRQGAGAASLDTRGVLHTAWFDGPFTNAPRLSTGAGDHFNGGFSFAQALGLPLDECLAVGTAVSGAYVRDAASPSLDRVAEFLRNLPVPELPAG